MNFTEFMKGVADIKSAMKNAGIESIDLDSGAANKTRVVLNDAEAVCAVIDVVTPDKRETGNNSGWQTVGIDGWLEVKYWDPESVLEPIHTPPF